jgi:hypothetical protein
MARKKTLQTNFSAGELAPELAMRQDTEQYRNGAKSLRNMRCLIGGGVTRRPGLRRLAEITQDSVAVEFIINQTTTYILCFSAGRVDAFLPDGTAAGSVGGCPWTGTIWSRWTSPAAATPSPDACHRCRIQVLTRTGAASWSRTAFAFFTGVGGRTEQPYFKVARAASRCSRRR